MPDYPDSHGRRLPLMPLPHPLPRFIRTPGPTHPLRPGTVLCLAALAGLLAAMPARGQNSLALGQTALDHTGAFRRCLWVTRWDYASPEDVARICYNAASARFTDILFQVRGAGTVFYPSAVEPWAGELSGRSGAAGVGWDPGWDPLATALREGHRWGLRVHAYLNVLPGWSGGDAPARSSGQLYAAHRDWFMVDSRGRTMRPGDWYTFLDPALPEVRAHLARLFGDLARRYPVDGVHLDYIRYPHEKGSFSYQPRVLDAFRRLFGGKPDRLPNEWMEFRRSQVTAAP
ncbi:MAG: family 10 glycosylhydrolase, partial [bacterium]|nr:family 10 glycosylhydrolase [bacterium]